MQKSVFVIGGTGVMGKFLVEKLLSRGVRVDAATLDDVKNENAALHYYKQNFMDLRTLERFLSGRHYDAIVDFMTYSTAQLAERFELLLKSCGQYMFLSSYRVYADAELPTREASPRILDITQDRELLQSDDYSLSARVQLRYDRLMQREMDNRKVLLAAGMQQADFTPLAEGLSRVLAALPENADFPEAFQLWHVDAAMDAYAAAHPALI